MKNKVLAAGIISIALVIGFLLAGCEESEPEIECGYLTVNNAPALGSRWRETSNEYVDEEWHGGVFFNEDPDSVLALSNWTIANCVAYFDNDKPPFKLMDERNTGEGFTKSGTYMVYLYIATTVRHETYFLPDVVFKNGNATIDFNNMKAEKDLPYSK